MFGAVLAGTLAFTAGPARAGDESRADEGHTRRARQLLERLDEPDAHQASWRNHFSIQKKHGFQYRQPLRVGERNLVFAVHGPVVAKKTFGLGFAIHF